MMNAARQLKPSRGARLNRTHPLARGLVGCWIFNEGSGDKVYDLSGYGNHGTLTNMDPATDWVGGKHGWALDFDGSNDYVDTADAPFQLANGTFEAWAYADDIDTHYLASKDLSGYHDDFWLYLIGSSPHILQFGIDSGSTEYKVDSDAEFPLTTWTHIAVVWGSGGMKMYIDGVLQADTDSHTGGVVANGRNFVIGAGKGNAYNWDGLIGLARIYNRGLSPAEVALLHDEPFCMFEEPVSRSIFIMPGNPRWYYQRQKMRRAM